MYSEVTPYRSLRFTCILTKRQAETIDLVKIGSIKMMKMKNKHVHCKAFR